MSSGFIQSAGLRFITGFTVISKFFKNWVVSTVIFSRNKNLTAISKTFFNNINFLLSEEASPKRYAYLADLVCLVFLPCLQTKHARHQFRDSNNQTGSSLVPSSTWTGFSKKPKTY